MGCPRARERIARDLEADHIDLLDRCSLASSETDRFPFIDLVMHHEILRCRPVNAPPWLPSSSYQDLTRTAFTGSLPRGMSQKMNKRETATELQGQEIERHLRLK